jgi:hypothetical protein
MQTLYAPEGRYAANSVGRKRQERISKDKDRWNKWTIQTNFLWTTQNKRPLRRGRRTEQARDTTLCYDNRQQKRPMFLKYKSKWTNKCCLQQVGDCKRHQSWLLGKVPVTASGWWVHLVQTENYENYEFTTGQRLKSAPNPTSHPTLG